MPIQLNSPPSKANPKPQRPARDTPPEGGASPTHSGRAGASAWPLSARASRQDTEPSTLVSHVGTLRLQPRMDVAALAKRLERIEAKSTPKMSDKHQAGVFLNGKVTLQGEPPDLTYSTNVNCMHMANDFARHLGKKRAMANQFSTAEGIREHFRGRLGESAKQAFDTLVNAPPASRHLVGEKQLGQYMAAVARALVQSHHSGGATESNTLLTTHDHLMALHVERKSKDGADYFTAKLYDPNESGNFVRVEAATPQALAHLTLLDMLSEENQAQYRGPSGDLVCLAAVALDPNVAPQLTQTQCLPEAGFDEDALAQALHMSMDCGLSTALRELSATKAPPASPFNLALFCRLECRSEWGTTGFAKALLYGHTDAIKAFGEIVKKSGLNEARQADLLAAEAKEGGTGLSVSMYFGFEQSLPVFGDVVAQSGLSSETQRDLLRATTKNGHSACFALALAGLPIPAKAYADMVKKVGLPAAMHEQLLACPSASGEPVLALVAREGQAANVPRVASMVAESGLPASAQARLLAAKDPKGTPALALALARGHTDTVLALGQAYAAAGLQKQALMELLVAMEANGTVARQSARHSRDPDTFQAYRALVDQAPLSATEKAAVMAGHAVPDAPVLQTDGPDKPRNGS